MSLGLSKSRFVAGLQCPKMLWWKVHEPDAPELTVDAGLQAVFDRGNVVGEVARGHVPGGVLIDLPHNKYKERVAATAQAITDGAAAVYEASFLEDGVFVSVDILQRTRGGFVLAEVKSTTKLKPQHLPDVAVQTHVVRRAGISITRADLMHLNSDCRFPDLSNLFARENVTQEIAPLLREVPGQIKNLRRMLAGPLPKVAIGPHCTDPYECPFIGRCWPEQPEHHVSTLYRIRSTKVEAMVAAGHETIHDLPEKHELSGIAARQVRSVRADSIVVESGLGVALAAVKPPVAFLDFETVGLPIPVWPGCGPFQAVPVQFSCHTVGIGKGAGGGAGKTRLAHHEWLAEGPGDPRRPFARALLAACKGATTVLAYNASFEKGCIEGLAAALPDLAKALRKLSASIQDLLPIVRDHVYHPAFGGSFSIKSVLPALVTGLGYGDLAIQDGQTASIALEGWLFAGASMPAKDRKMMRRDLLAYCERDTLAMVKLHDRLVNLAGA